MKKMRVLAKISRAALAKKGWDLEPRSLKRIPAISRALLS